MPKRGQGPRLKWLQKRSKYYIVWSESGRSYERSTGTTDRAEAEIALADFIHQRRKKEGPLDPSEVLITDILADYAEQRGPEVVRADRIAYAIVPMAQYFENWFAGNLTREACKNYMTWRNRSNGTMRRELGVLRAAIGHAHLNGVIVRPIPVFLPEKPEAKDRWLTRQEVADLLFAARKLPKARYHLPLFILMALYTGQRKEAILSLRWSQVDLDAQLIDFNQPGRQRTKKRRARSRIAKKLLPHLIRAKRYGRKDGPVIHIHGEPIKDVKRSFAAACKIAGLEGVTPHVLRHTSATWLMQKGVSIWDASGFLCMSAETLQRVYGHHHPDFQRNAADAF